MSGLSYFVYKLLNFISLLFIKELNSEKNTTKILTLVQIVCFLIICIVQGTLIRTPVYPILITLISKSDSVF